ncbi:hypothetical protein [Nocardia wallacei]|uniref:hypothetical protein n=1 Tax=Nocardia wallacei TaxID=480035 RepID=UPI0024538C78|nr:hypothetical protein [Nocardia wallacei]
MTMVLPVATAATTAVDVSCRRLRLRADIHDPRAWRVRVDRLLAAGRGRWSGRTDFAACPALRRWGAIGYPPVPDGQVTLFSAVAAAAAGIRMPDAGAPAELSTAVMLLSGCPAVIDRFDPALALARPGALTLSVFALPADDLALARDLAETVLTASGTLVFRRETTVTVPAAARHAGARHPMPAAAW